MQLTKTKQGKINTKSVNKLVVFTTGFIASFIAAQATLTPLAIAAQKTSETSKASDLSSVVNNNSEERLLAQRLCRSYRVTRSAGLYVYHGNRVVATIPYNTIVSVSSISADGSWAQVSYGGGYGWVARTYLGCYQQ